MSFQVLTIQLLIMYVTFVNSHSQYEYGYNTNAKRYTRTVQLKQGQLQGVIVEPRVKHALAPVEQYLGIPYAAAPVGELRFMPPGSAPPWYGTKIADKFGPVCPQKFPNKDEMAPDRREYFERLVQHLNESDEDCLYLNIYAPVQESSRIARKYPVMIFLHGESFEWNSGNPYDGSVLAAYGHVIVVTLNYRLGILGFLKAGLNDQTRSNFGLVDQVAALLWVQQNIAAFGGDPAAVTLMGHGTGAVSAGLLMLSPMVEQDGHKLLFQRAILMSGSALADWALAGNPRQVTFHVAEALNCPLDDTALASCLRRKRLEEIISAKVVTPVFMTKFGPIVDGLVVPNDPKQHMTVYNGLFKRFELLYGLTELESAHLLRPVDVTYGMLERERDEQLYNYLNMRCQFHPQACLAQTLSQYSGTQDEYIEDEPTGMFPTRQELDRATVARDTLLDVLSDARSAAPLIQTAKYHASVNPSSYFYVFGHTTSSKKFLRNKSVNGEELPYVFGVPLDGPKFHYRDYYTQREILFSEAIMTFWTNFAHTGNPNAPKRHAYYTLGAMDWKQYEIDWPEYDLQNEQYLYLTIPPRIEQRYRSKEIQYWNEILPDLLKNHTTGYREIYKPPYKTKPKPIPPWIHPTPNVMPPKNRFTIFDLKPTSGPKETTYGIVKTKPDVPVPGRDAEGDMMGNMEYGTPITAEPETQTASSTNIIITIGVLILLINLLAFAVIFIRKYRTKKKEDEFKRKYDSDNIETIAESVEKRSKFDPNEGDDDNRGCSLIKMMGKSSKSEDTYEAVKPSEGSGSQFKLTRQVSTSTIDPHTKVRDWITNEIVQRYSPRFLRRTRQQLFMEHKLNQQKTTEIKKEKERETVGSNSTLGQSPTRPVSPIDKVGAIEQGVDGQKLTPQGIHSKSTVKKPEKVSVAIDATPSGRGSSVLRQEPIEITKSLDCPRIQPDGETPLRRSVTLDDCTDATQKDDLLRTNSVNLTEESTIVRIEHHHSRSDPVQETHKSPFYAYSTPVVPLQLKTFNRTTDEDINVTSRDERPPEGHNQATPEDALMTIKRRNFPKVLPDFPNDGSAASMAHKRRSMPVPGALFLPIQEVGSTSYPNSPDGQKIYGRVPPAPPPRVSTLPRNASAAMCHSSPATVATEPPPPPRTEPEMSCVNNLFVGTLSSARSNSLEQSASPDSYRLNTQPIYDNLRPAKQTAEQKPEPKSPKTIITTDPNQPIKRVEPKVIIKPTITRKNNDVNKNKNIPRVFAKDAGVGATKPQTENVPLPKQCTDNKEHLPTATTNEHKQQSNVPVVKSNAKPKLQKASQIPTFTKNSVGNLSKENSSSESSPSEESDTGTVVKRVIE